MTLRDQLDQIPKQPNPRAAEGVYTFSQEDLDKYVEIHVRHARPAIIEECARVCENIERESTVEMFNVAMRLAATAIRALKEGK